MNKREEKGEVRGWVQDGAPHVGPFNHCKFLTFILSERGLGKGLKQRCDIILLDFLKESPGCLLG